VVTIGKSNTQYATTTILLEASLTAETQPVMVLLATSTGGGDVTAGKYAFGPAAGKKWLVFGIPGGTNLVGPTGVCEATWQVLR